MRSGKGRVAPGIDPAGRSSPRAISAPFAGRQGLTRAKLLRREGGTARSEKSVDDGLDWIVRHQRADGSWSLNFHDQCQAEPCPFSSPRTQSDTAATGLALLPLLGAGHIHTVKCRYQESVRRGLEWLTAHQTARRRPLHRARRAWLTFTVTRSPRWPFAKRTACPEIASLQPAARRAVEFICNSQDPVGGGWRYSPGQPGDTSVFGWNIFALRSAHLAGIKVPQKILKACSRYLDQAATDRSRVTYLYQPGGREAAIFSTR